MTERCQLRDRGTLRYTVVSVVRLGIKEDARIVGIFEGVVILDRRAVVVDRYAFGRADFFPVARGFTDQVGQAAFPDFVGPCPSERRSIRPSRNRCRAICKSRRQPALHRSRSRRPRHRSMLCNACSICWRSWRALLDGRSGCVVPLSHLPKVAAPPDKVSDSTRYACELAWIASTATNASGGGPKQGMKEAARAVENRTERFDSVFAIDNMASNPLDQLADARQGTLGRGVLCLGRYFVEHFFGGRHQRAGVDMVDQRFQCGRLK